MSPHSHDDESSSDLGPVVSRPVPTPRGGFMARPGLKMPPRHAVVVRVGNAPQCEEIPVARSSAPPPPPVEQATQEPAAIASSEKPTIPAIRTPKPPAVQVDSSERPTHKISTVLPPPPESPAPAWSARGIESMPPPSDSPVTKSVRLSTPSPRARRASWPIVIAAAIGLVLGLVSIATSTNARRSAAAEAPLPAPGVDALSSPPRSMPSARVTERKSPQARSPALSAAARSAQPLPPPRKKSIF